MILVFISFESKEDGEKVANYLVDNKLAACVSLVPVQSFYYWKGEKMIIEEYEAIIKTKKSQFVSIENAIKELLPYEIPQIIAVDAVNANKSYLMWVNESLKKRRL